MKILNNKFIFILFILFVLNYVSCRHIDHINYNDIYWYKLSSKYVDIDQNVLIKHTIVRDYFKKKNELKDKILRTKIDNNIIYEMLVDGNIKDKRIAILNIYLRKIDIDKMLDQVFLILNENDDKIINLYGYKCFEIVSDKLDKYKNTLLELLKEETDVNAISYVLPLLPKLISDEVIINLFSKYLTSENETLRCLSYLYFKRDLEKSRKKLVIKNLKAKEKLPYELKCGKNIFLLQ